MSFCELPSPLSSMFVFYKNTYSTEGWVYSLIARKFSNFFPSCHVDPPSLLRASARLRKNTREVAPFRSAFADILKKLT